MKRWQSLLLGLAPVALLLLAAQVFPPAPFSLVRIAERIQR